MVKRSIARRLQIYFEKKGRDYARKAVQLGNSARAACVNYAGEDVVRSIGERENKQIVLHEQASSFVRHYVGSLPYQFDQLVVEMKEFREEVKRPLDMKMGYFAMFLWTLVVMYCAYRLAEMAGRGFRMYGYRYADIDPKLEWSVKEYM